MSFDQKELALIGHWSSTSRMPERYDRSTCATELLLRNTIVQQIVGGWSMAPAYHLPETVTGHVRIGKENDTTVKGTSDALKLDDLGVETRDTPPGESNDELKCELPPTQIDENQVTKNLTEDQKSEPKTDVLALGTPALDNPIILPNTNL